MEQLFTFGLTNAVSATLLALAAAAIAHFSRRPVLWYALWLVVLLRLLAPPIFAIDLAIPDIGRGAADATAPVIEVAGGAVRVAETGFSLDPIAVVAALWAAGAMAVFGFAIAQSLQLRQVLVASEPAPDDLGNRVADLSRRLGLNRAPPTVVVEDRVPPMLWAFLGSVRLILPNELLNRLDEGERDTLLAHELAHLSRRDHWVRHLELAALAIFWWNPVAWWATKRVRRAQELCCDQRVSELLPKKRRAYADTLVETARFLSGRNLPLGSPARAMADLTEMKGRIQMIMTTGRSHNISLAARITAAAMLLAVLVITPMLTAGTEEPDPFGRPISLNLQEADLHDVLATFSKVSAVKILIEPGISGTVTASFEDVPWDEALFQIIDEQGLTYHREGDQIIVRRSEGEKLVPVVHADGKPPSRSRLVGQLNGDEVFRYIPDGKISEPVVLERVPPKYPPEARKAGVTGVVVADLLIDEVGMVRDAVIQESPSDDLSAAAIKAFEQWRFAPAMMNDKPVAVRYIVTVRFNLK